MKKTTLSNNCKLRKNQNRKLVWDILRLISHLREFSYFRDKFLTLIEATTVQTTGTSSTVAVNDEMKNPKEEIEI